MISVLSLANLVHKPQCMLSVQLASSPGLFPEDIVARARDLGPAIKLGAYSASVGHPKLRKLIAEGITRRDGHPADPDSIMLGSVSSARSGTSPLCLSGGVSGFCVVHLSHNALYISGQNSCGHFLWSVADRTIWVCKWLANATLTSPVCFSQRQKTVFKTVIKVP
jgi:hypothetical protein